MKCDLEGQGQSAQKNYRDPILVNLAWTSDELWCEKAAENGVNFDF